ncbi:Homeobox protein isoform 1 [Dorcoceras hygrometricum]|uniref:Homeobox-leucine zipper protein n=1 Tax=Dorcoceras hygrometricum TaxID=472368 RepID=A0A2Z7AJI1_9LAMI|nr:Homeobox protein isoform 1 [Dorcoceras hygrometricum]
MMMGRGMIGGGGGGGGGNVPNQKQKLKISSLDQPFDSIFAPASLNPFTGSGAMVDFGAFSVNMSGNLFCRSLEQEEICGDEHLDEYFNHPEKKRRLTVDQVQFLEKSFEAENKLEPERKSQLAVELGLQPRQIAIWFQNRRARLRTKQVETDYETLNEKYNCLKIDYDNLLKENEKLNQEVFHLKENLNAKEKEKENSQSCIMKGPCELWIENPISATVSNDEESTVLAMACLNEDQSEARSDSSTGTDSLCYNNGRLSLLLETCDSSQVFEPERSDFSDESLQLSYVLPKMEEGYCHTSPANPWFPIEDHGFSFWSY